NARDSLVGARESIADGAAGIRRATWRVGIRPKLRRRELTLLALVAVCLAVGWVSLATLRAQTVTFGDISPLVTYLVVLFVIHAAFVIAGRDMDQILLPAVALLG